MKKLLSAYEKRKGGIRKRLGDFKETGKDRDKTRLEMFFCLCTPQSRALSCWAAVEEMREKGLLENGTQEEISRLISAKGIRFCNTKAKHIVEARVKFDEIWDVIKASPNPHETREWLVRNVKGYGYKEASHFLRNVGFEDLAILDRHILKNLKRMRIIKKLPKALTKKSYFEIEKSFREFSERIGIRMDELDLALWAEEAGIVFK